MKYYRFQRSVVVKGVTRHEGDVISETELPPGCRDSCLRMGHIVETDPQVEAFTAAMEQPKQPTKLKK